MDLMVQLRKSASGLSKLFIWVGKAALIISGLVLVFLSSGGVRMKGRALPSLDGPNVAFADSRLEATSDGSCSDGSCSDGSSCSSDSSDDACD